MISKRPSQKLGTLVPTRATVIAAVSTVEPCRAAAMMPSGTPSSTATASPASASSKVALSRSTISSPTGRPWR